MIVRHTTIKLYDHTTHDPQTLRSYNARNVLLSSAPYRLWRATQEWVQFRPWPALINHLGKSKFIKSLDLTKDFRRFHSAHLPQKNSLCNQWEPFHYKMLPFGLHTLTFQRQMDFTATETLGSSLQGWFWSIAWNGIVTYPIYRRIWIPFGRQDSQWTPAGAS